VIIARALAQEPSVLVLDEPVSHLDIKHQIGLMELTKKFCREKNIMVLAILHDLNFAMAYCDQVMLVRQGSIKEDGKPEAVLTQARIKEVYDIDVYIIDHPIKDLPYIMTV
jgi:iron complex transport system ATP-binding protein